MNPWESVFEGENKERLQQCSLESFPAKSGELLQWMEDVDRLAVLDSAQHYVVARELLEVAQGKNKKEKDLIIEQIKACSWLSRTSPLPGITEWNLALWKWCLHKTVVAPVYVPIVKKNSKKCYISCLNIVYITTGNGDLKDFPQGDAKRYGDSYDQAIKALKKIEDAEVKEIHFERIRIFAKETEKVRGKPIEGKSASLGIALAIWAAYKHRIDDTFSAREVLASKYVVTGELQDNTDGKINPIGSIDAKANHDIFKKRRLMAPREHRCDIDDFDAVNLWFDAKFRLQPKYTKEQEGEIPECDVLFGVASKMTEPHLQIATLIRPKHFIVLLYSENEKESGNPARRIKACLEKNKKAWGGEQCEIILRKMNSYRLGLAEIDVNTAWDWIKKRKDKQKNTCVNITGGNKIMGMAIHNIFRGEKYPLIYRELYEKHYTIIDYDRNNNVTATNFFKEPTNFSYPKDFDEASVAKCITPENDKGNTEGILLGNTFPLSLIRKKVTTEPEDIKEFRKRIQGKEIHSFWGHSNTIEAANAQLGIDVTPKTERPAIKLGEEGKDKDKPMLDGQVFSSCWVLSPDYVENFRPKVGEAVAADKIKSWQVLCLRWL